MAAGLDDAGAETGVVPVDGTTATDPGGAAWRGTAARTDTASAAGTATAASTVTALRRRLAIRCDRACTAASRSGPTGACAACRPVHPFDPVPPPVYPREDLLDEVLGEVGVAAQHMGEAQQGRPTDDHELVEPAGHPPPLTQQDRYTYVDEPGALTSRSRRTTDRLAP